MRCGSPFRSRGVIDDVTCLRRYHLLGIEAINSSPAAALLGVGATAADYRLRFDVLIQAAWDREAGTVLGDDHSPDIEVFIGPAAPKYGIMGRW